MAKTSNFLTPIINDFLKNYKTTIEDASSIANGNDVKGLRPDQTRAIEKEIKDRGLKHILKTYTPK